MSESQPQNNFEEPCLKKIKTDHTPSNGSSNNDLQLKDFILEKILTNNTNRKSACVLGKFKTKEGDALILLEKNAFRDEDLSSNGYFSSDSVLKTFFINDIYGNFECFPNSEINGVKTTIIYPATQKHIDKFSQQEVHIVLETPELYNSCTLVHIEKEQFTLQWVHNILEGKSEQDRIVFDDKCEQNGFVLLPDLKWDGLTKETLYLLAIVRKVGIKSLRDLNGEHLGLLKNIRDKGKKVIQEKYNIPGSQLRIYLHYQPSFYHLHIHFTYLKHDAPGIYTEKSHLLDTVINNIEMMSDYYQKVTLPFVVKETDKLYKMFENSSLQPNNSDDYRRNDSVSSIESLSDYSDDDIDLTTVIPIDKFCQIIPNSMSGLKIDKSNVSFRILTESSDGGGFYKEILNCNSLSKSSSLTLKINLLAKENVKILCHNCSNVVSDNDVKFDRILELPTSNLDVNDWFCHNHSHSQPEVPVTTVKPYKNDFLYRLTYFVINLTELSEKSNKFNSKREVYHCNRCLAWLGLKSKETVKLFNSTIKINQNNIESTVFKHSLTDNLCVNDFVYTIEKMTKEFDLGLQYSVMCKILLECNMSTTKNYLLIWIIDKELQVLQNTESVLKTVELHSSFLKKILFKVEITLNDEVESWMSDPGVVTSEISKNMFKDGVEHLHKMSKKVPECFRHTNGFTVSYLNI